MANTTNIRFHAIYDLFLADLDNGGVRVGMLGMEAFDFQTNHPSFKEANELTPHTIEQFYDERFEKYCVKGEYATFIDLFNKQ